MTPKRSSHSPARGRAAATKIVARLAQKAVERRERATAKPVAERVAAKLAEKPGGRVVETAARKVAKVGTKVAGSGRRARPGASAAQQQIVSAAGRRQDARDAVDQSDIKHMRRALALAEQYRGRTSPNPVVGCVIVDEGGRVIAEGAHHGPGQKHAEIDALDQLGGTARGGTLYVTLEPCTHHGLTPPCAPVVAAAKLARVVIGSLDPIAGHGGGAKWLAKQGVTISRVLGDECDLANLPFFTAALSRRAAFTLKAAITLDGKIATVSGESQWITGTPAREHGHRLRSMHDAVLVGIGTVLADDPQLTARISGGRDPVRIVVDSELRTPPNAKVLPGRRGPRTIIATTESGPASRARALEAAGAEVWRFPATRGKVSLGALASRLVEDNIQSVLVEGGGQIHAALLAEGLATDLQLFIAPRIVGGPAASWVGGDGVAKLADAWRLHFVGEPERLGEDLLVRAVVRRA